MKYATVLNSPLSLVSLVVAALVATGCTGSVTSPSSLSGSPTSSVDQSPRSGSPTPTVDGLAGTWNLQSLQAAGDVDQTTPAGASYTLTFADGRLTTRADCNSCGGEFTLSGQTLTADPHWRARGQRVPPWRSSPPTPVCSVAKATCPCRTPRWCCRRREECCASRDRPRMLWRRVSSMRHRVIGHCGGRRRTKLPATPQSAVHGGGGT